MHFFFSFTFSVESVESDLLSLDESDLPFNFAFFVNELMWLEKDVTNRVILQKYLGCVCVWGVIASVWISTCAAAPDWPDEDHLCR